MIHQPECPLFNQEGEGRTRKKTLIRVIADQLPKPRKQFENEKNALKISDEKVISAINQHLTEATVTYMHHKKDTITQTKHYIEQSQTE
jgi:hypothetical protein